MTSYPPTQSTASNASTPKLIHKGTSAVSSELIKLSSSSDRANDRQPPGLYQVKILKVAELHQCCHEAVSSEPNAWKTIVR
uniref:Uncharacterized protein n=1 Tax=Anguilla anguilla TaxID=7936 RepID=A0A0E9W6V3_ANGAN